MQENRARKVTDALRDRGIDAHLHNEGIDIYGVRVADSAEYKSLGKGGDITKAQHCRAEVYIGGYGWLPVDPADVRKVVLEEPELVKPRVVAELNQRPSIRNRLIGVFVPIATIVDGVIRQPAKLHVLLRRAS